MSVDHELSTNHTRVVARSDRAPGMHWSFRTDRIVKWVGWHLIELTATATLVVLAFAAHPLWAFPAVAVAAAWGANEVRLNRRPTSRGGALTSTPQTGTDTASPNPADVRGGDVPGEEDTRGSA
jgi:hypothetical protein